MTEQQSWKLTIVAGFGAGRSFTLSDETSIGREVNNNIILNESQVSRKHAVIHRQGVYYVLVDQGSSNGTFVNGNRVIQPVQLQSGDQITIGETQITINDPSRIMLDAPDTVMEAPATVLETPPVESSRRGGPREVAPRPIGPPIQSRNGTPVWIWLAGVGAIVVMVILAVTLIGSAGFLAGQNIESDPDATAARVPLETDEAVDVEPQEIINGSEPSESGEEVPSRPSEPSATLGPLPSATPIPVKTDTELPSPTVRPFTPTPDIADLMQNAEILLFEDIAGVYLNRFVKQALDNSGMGYTDVADRVGDLKSELLSGKSWDLIIMAVEARSAVQGEFFDYLNTHLTDGAGVILEIWNLDKIGGGRASQILARCGVAVQSDWNNPPSRSVMWLVPDHPIFHEPNDGVALVNYTPYWEGDAGDLLRKVSGSDAIMLGGTLATEKDRYGTLVSCMEGRLIIQTHSTHDYRAEVMVPLWQNYIDYTLRSRFAANP